MMVNIHMGIRMGRLRDSRRGTACVEVLPMHRMS